MHTFCFVEQCKSCQVNAMTSKTIRYKERSLNVLHFCFFGRTQIFGQADLYFFWSVSDHFSTLLSNLSSPHMLYKGKRVFLSSSLRENHTIWRELNFYGVINYHSWLQVTFACIKQFFEQVCLALQDPNACCNAGRRLINKVVE